MIRFTMQLLFFHLPVQASVGGLPYMQPYALQLLLSFHFHPAANIGAATPKNTVCLWSLVYSKRIKAVKCADVAGSPSFRPTQERTKEVPERTNSVQLGLERDDESAERQIKQLSSHLSRNRADKWAAALRLDLLHRSMNVFPFTEGEGNLNMLDTLTQVWVDFKMSNLC